MLVDEQVRIRGVLCRNWRNWDKDQWAQVRGLGPHRFASLAVRKTRSADWSHRAEFNNRVVGTGHGPVRIRHGFS
jgi:hypothetical protein